MRLLLWVFLLLLVMSITSGCAGLPANSLDGPKIRYQLSLSGVIDGNNFHRTAIGTSAESHVIRIDSQVDVNYFTVQSCHRSEQFLDVIKTGWLTPKRSYQWTYTKMPAVEDDGDCILRLCAFSKEVGAPPSSCAVIDFKHAKYSLPSENICNGKISANTGTSICHTQAGLVQRVRFKTSVVTAPPIPTEEKVGTYWIKNQCQGRFLDSAQTLFEYYMPPDECVIIFMEKALPRRRAKLTAIPYDATRYPGGK